MNGKLSKLLKTFKRKSQKTFFSSTFCPLPWTQFTIAPQGPNVYLCAHSCHKSLKTESGKPYSFKTYNFDEIWNSQNLREIRRKMLSGEKVENCQRCYEFEAMGKFSLRNLTNQEWLNDSLLKKFVLSRKVRKGKKNVYKVPPPDILDIGFGNLCNLQCRMCSPENSSKIQEEYEILSKRYTEELSYLRNDLEILKRNKNWYKDPKLLENIYRWVPYLREILFIGGEPTLIKEVWEVIDYLREKGYAKNMSLQININCTYIPEKLLDTFNYFKRVTLHLSIDGYKEVNEYIRHPSKWEVIERNVEHLLKKKNKKTRIIIYPTLQIYNIFYITELFQWADQLSQLNNVFLCSDHLQIGHKKLDIDILPKNIKQICLSKILNYEKNHKYHKYLNRKIFFMNWYKNRKVMCFYNGLEFLKNYLKRDPPSDSKSHLVNFRIYTEMLDKNRGNSFQKTFPELYDLLEEDGSWRQ